ncbi:MAG: ribonuclease HI family protein [bacterium]|nr:ribonuclease HI family protein [bacterium]
MSKEKLIIYTDGGSRGNPGPSALGVSIKDSSGKILREFGETLGRRTNNEAEYEAIVAGLKKAKAMLGKTKAKKMTIDMRMDSELACRQLNHIYKVENEKIIPLFLQIWNLMLDFGEVTFTHVLRDKNKDADRMVNEALDGEQGTLL